MPVRTSPEKRPPSRAKKPNFFRPVWAEINHAHLKSNFTEVARVAAAAQILAVVKANAYGHGLVSVSRTLSRLGVKFLGVTSVEESLVLREAAIKTPALILGNIFPFESLEPVIKNETRVTVASVDSASLCDAFAKKLGRKVHAHAKIDTGMGRIGVNVRNALAFVKKILEFRKIELEGIYTHLSSVPEDAEFTRKQIELFCDFAEELKAQNIRVPYVHCANSAAIFRHPNARFNLVRPGLSLYGVSPVPVAGMAELKPVLSWKSRIIFLKDVPEGTAVSYAHTFVTRRKSRIATAAFGYADGFRRSLSNKAWVLVNGRRVPTIGRITMDMTMLDVTDLPSVQVGDEVVIVGEQSSEKISVQELAVWAETSAYEMLCGISARVPRVDITA